MPKASKLPKYIADYYAQLERYRTLGSTGESTTEHAFKTLLSEAGQKHKWTLVKHSIPSTRSGTVVPDGILKDDFNLPRGYWEAKDTDDDLDVEIQKKIAKGYPLENTIFEDTRRAVLFQNGRECLDADITEPHNLIRLLDAFFGYEKAQIETFHRAVVAFREQIPNLAKALFDRIDEEKGKNAEFGKTFREFHELCRKAVNPDLSIETVEEMIVQHLLTERIFRRVFNVPEFVRKNVIAVEIEKVIDALTSKAFSRDEYLKRLDYFYVAIEEAARDIADYHEKQKFLNTVYEQFFQGWSRKTADTHGIVYTPQEIVNFMVESVEKALGEFFGKSLSDAGVHILDPCVGTGNFITAVIRRIQPSALRRKYENELHCNEIMLLPYYIASMNIEHEYYEKTGEYDPFEGICFADTLDMTDAPQLSLFSEKNTERVEQQKASDIFAIIGNPPYNVGQKSENDNNKNRKHKLVDDRIRETYVKDSKATNNNQLYDAYVRFFRWATDL